MSSDQSDTSSAGDEGQSIGSYLSAQRRLRGISLDELSTRLRVPVRSLERLEAGFFDGQVDGFVRGFVRTVALDLGLDPDDAVMRMMAEPGAARGMGRALGSGPRRLLAVALLGAIVLVVGGGLWMVARATLELGSDVRTVVRHDPVRALADAERDGPPAVGTRGESEPRAISRRP